MKAEIERAVAAVTGKALWRCLRAADMATFDFGKRRKSIDFRGNEREVGELALHVQCAWRITQHDRVIVGARDLYFPADYQQGEVIPQEFDWDKHPNRRDKLLASFFENDTRQLIVQTIEVGSAGSLHVVLENGFSLDVFPDDSLSGEHWRLFEPDREGPHFVVTGDGIET